MKLILEPLVVAAMLMQSVPVPEQETSNTAQEQSTAPDSSASAPHS